MKLFITYALVVSYALSFSKGDSSKVYTHFDKRNEISSSLSFDQENLYLTLSTSNQIASSKILFRGLTIFFNDEGKKKKNIFFQYPLSEEYGSTAHESEPLNKHPFLLKPLIDSLYKKLPKDAIYGKNDRIERIPLAFTGLGISITIQMEEDQPMYYKLTIPIKKITDKKFDEIESLRIGYDMDEFDIPKYIYDPQSKQDVPLPTSSIRSHMIDPISYWFKVEL